LKGRRSTVAKKMLVFCGSDAPEKAFPPFMLSSGALSADMEVTLFFTMSGLNIVRKGGAEKITLDGAPKTLPEFVDLVKELGARLVACSAAFGIAKMKEEDLIQGVITGGVATFIKDAQGADVVLTF
jgi:predicted peroxiredoxin